jgi:hypothetical protein
MKGDEKWRVIQAAKFAQDQDIAKRDAALKQKVTDANLRHSAVTTAMDQTKLQNLLNPQQFQPNVRLVPNPAGGPPVSVFQGSANSATVMPQPTPHIGGGRIDVDPVTGQPKYDLQRGVYYSGGQPFLLNDQQTKSLQMAEDARNAAAAGSNVPGVSAINSSIADEQGKLAAGRSGLYTLFPGVTVGTPRTNVIQGLQAKKNALMQLFGAQSQGNGAGPSAGAPPPAAAPPGAAPALPAGGAAPAGKVRVISPQGQSGTIPADQLPTYIQAGYRQASAGPDSSAGVPDFMQGLENLMA